MKEQKIKRKQKKKLLIIGCGRSGTLYSAEVWRALGLDFLHERDHFTNGKTGRDGFASWFLAADDPNPPFGPTDKGIEFDMVLHQVRDPLKVIPSVAQYILQKGIYSPGFITKHAPETDLTYAEQELDQKSQFILKAAKYWYCWNLMSQKKATETIKVEELENNLPRLCDHLNIDFKLENVKQISKKTNSRDGFILEEPWHLTWEELKLLDSSLYENIKKLASKYGY